MINHQENIIWHSHCLSKLQRRHLKKQKSFIIWFTGLSGSGKSTIANALELELFHRNKHTYLLDGDNIRQGLNSDLGFSPEGRKENIRRIGEVAKLMVDAGIIVLAAFISPYQADRDMVRSMVDKEEFIEVFIDSPLEICEKRDVKGLYRKARRGEIANFTGINAPYEKPQNPELHLDTAALSVEQSVQKIIEYIYI